tara:strand:- start:51837 stop:52388 length:552 start_codon:yes stop_codon:yes gene_type:complete
MKKIMILLILSMFLISSCTFFTSAPGTYKYGDYDITKVNDGGYSGYVTTVFINNSPNPTSMNTRHDPKSLEDIDINGDVKDALLTKKEIFLHLEDESLTGLTSIAGLEFNNLMERFYSIPVRYEDNLYSCNDVDATKGVVKLQLGDKTEIFLENNCVVFQGKTEQDLVRTADRVMFFLLGIMK